MATHKLALGNQIIDGLVQLGESLEYFVKKEHPIEKDKKNPPAIDVAWFSEEEQDFPLMIFEVESQVTNSVTNNPAKVFGKPNESFEKPLFYFHVMVTGGKNTSRVDVLRTLFGLHNYRAYELEKGKLIVLLKDILTQHRRLQRRLNLVEVVEVLSTDPWKKINISQILEYIEEIGFEKGEGTFLPRYAFLSRKDKIYQEHFIRYLKQEYDFHNRKEFDKYNTFIGNWWWDAVYLGILITNSDDKLEKSKYFEILKYWQDDSTFFKQIAPIIGFNPDYDRAVLGLAASFWALIFILTRDLKDANKYIVKQCMTILTKLDSFTPKISFFSALWFLHITAAANLISEYNYVRNFINKKGGISRNVLYRPIGSIDISEEENWLNDGENIIKVPSFSDFKRRVKSRVTTIRNKKQVIISLALESLIDIDTPFKWEKSLVNLLHS